MYVKQIWKVLHRLIRSRYGDQGDAGLIGSLIGIEESFQKADGGYLRSTYLH
jgi:hypothetical protein